MKHIAVLIPDGVSYRNFVLSGVLAPLLASYRLTLLHWHALEPDIVPDGVETIKVATDLESFTAWLLRRAKVFSQLFRHWRSDRNAIVFRMQFQRSARKGLQGFLLWYLQRMAGLLFAPAVLAQPLERLHAASVRRTGGYTGAHRTLADLVPDLVFCPHQRASVAVPYMLAARDMGICTAVFIHSWDNLPKGRMAVHAAHVLVWSTRMKYELLYYYPEREPSSVHAIGSPQFDTYAVYDGASPRSEVFRDPSIHDDTKVVLYSGDDTLTSPHDPVYLADVAEAVRTLAQQLDVRLAFRSCPVEPLDRYAWVFERYPEIIVLPPKWSHADGVEWHQVYPTAADVSHLAELVHACDLVINIGSTMAFDFALHDKPAVYIRYEVVPPSRKVPWSINDIYRLKHFELVHELQPVSWINDRSEVVSVIQESLDQPDKRKLERRHWITEMLDDSHGRTGNKLYDFASCALSAWEGSSLDSNHHLNDGNI